MLLHTRERLLADGTFQKKVNLSQSLHRYTIDIEVLTNTYLKEAKANLIYLT